jgi:hypothetical protein
MERSKKEKKKQKEKEINHNVERDKEMLKG